MKKKDKCNDKITTDEYVDFKCGLALYELIAIIIGILLIIILP